MENEIRNKTALVAAKWWADKLRYGTTHDNGDNQQSFMMNLFLALAKKKEGFDEKIDEFESKLAELIDEELERRWSVYLRVDYHPEGLLYEAAQAVNIDVEYKLPVKTSMQVTKEEIQVAEGYGKEFTKLFPSGDKGPKK